jgi:hypothetical protein
LASLLQKRGELVFDTSRGSPKYHNLSAFAQVALVIGWDNEMTGFSASSDATDRSTCVGPHSIRSAANMDLRSGEKAATNRFRTRYRQTATAGTGDGARPINRLADPERPGPGISEAQTPHRRSDCASSCATPTGGSRTN